MFGVSGTGDTSGYGGLVAPGRDARRHAARRTAAGSTRSPTRLDAVLADEASPTRSRRSSSTAARSPSSSAASTCSTVAQQLRDDADAALRVLHAASAACTTRTTTGRELHAVYHLLSMTHNRRIRLEVTCPDADPHIPSVVAVYPTNDWHERETYDFFGIVFDGHPALTRIQMPDDWPGHPQRKDYPLGGIPVEYKGATIPPPDTRRSYN